MSCLHMTVLTDSFTSPVICSKHYNNVLHSIIGKNKFHLVFTSQSQIDKGIYKYINMGGA